MIARLSGILLEKGPESAVIEAGGVGYEVFLPLPALTGLPALGSSVQVHTHFHVREDAQVLYGFLDAADKQAFLLLLTVKGVGPKVALGILSHINGSALARALGGRDLGVLTQVPGVGKKLAERLGVELSDKVQSLGLVSSGPRPMDGDPVLAALLALGYSQLQARQALEKAQTAEGGVSKGLEERIKAALKWV